MSRLSELSASISAGKFKYDPRVSLSTATSSLEAAISTLRSVVKLCDESWTLLSKKLPDPAVLQDPLDYQDAADGWWLLEPIAIEHPSVVVSEVCGVKDLVCPEFNNDWHARTLSRRLSGLVSGIEARLRNLRMIASEILSNPEMRALLR